MNNGTKAGFALSAAGLVALALSEGYSETPYLDGAGVWTDGFGNTVNVVQGKTRGFVYDLKMLLVNTERFERAVNRCVTGPMNQTRFDGLVHWAYNIGENAFCTSTAVKYLNAGDVEHGCNQIMNWTFITRGGRKLQCKDAVNFKYCGGLVDRRERERKACLAFN